MVLERYLGITIDGNALLPFWGQFAKTIFAHFAKTVGIQDTEPVEEMYAAFSAYSNANHNRLSTVYEGVEETLGDMKKAVHALGVVTTRPSDRSAPVLEMAWTRHIDFFVWGDQVRRNKPFSRRHREGDQRPCHQWCGLCLCGRQRQRYQGRPSLSASGVKRGRPVGRHGFRWVKGGLSGPFLFHVHGVCPLGDSGRTDRRVDYQCITICCSSTVAIF